MRIPLWLHILGLAITTGLLLSIPIRTLDTHFYYNHYEAIGFFAGLSAEQVQQVHKICAIDLFLYIPLYITLLYRFTGTNGRTALLALIAITAAADITETSLEWMGTYNIGIESAWLPMLMSLSTPTKWTAVLLWGLISSGFLFRRVLRHR